MKHPPAPLRAFPPLPREGEHSLGPGEASSPAALSANPSPAQVVSFVSVYIRRALNERVRYRYVQPRVLREGEAFRIEAPCCSRNVDPEGGVIDIALLTPMAGGGWQLHARDHAAGAWMLQQCSMQLDELMDVLCVDAQRLFWP